MSDDTRKLSGFTGGGYSIGRPKVVQALWLSVQGLVFQRWWCPARLRTLLLRAFGADIGRGVLIRHRVRVHWPWKLTIGDHSWIGEGTWLLNLEPITIGHDVVLSQETLVCTGSHDRRSPTFEFDNAPVVIGDGAWIAARAVVLRGVHVGARATIGAGAVVDLDVAPDDLILVPRAQTRRHQAGRPPL